MIILSYDEEFKLFYETAFKLQRHEVELLFQRFNFFLIGTAFLITAFATVVSSHYFAWLPYPNLVWLAHAINAVGFYIAIFFTIANYLNTRVIRLLGDYIRGLEAGNYPTPPHLYLKEETSRLSSKRRELIKEICREVDSIILSPFDFSKLRPAPHTWLIPLGFIFFWFLVWLFILPYVLLIGILGPLLLYILYLVLHRPATWLIKSIKNLSEAARRYLRSKCKLF
jgi:hypothetical protein